MDRGAALADGIGDGLGNPAAVVVDSGTRVRAGIAALQSPASLGVSAALASAAVGIQDRVTVGVSVAQAGMRDLIRTESDPTAVGGAIAYNTTLASVSVAARQSRWVTGGVAFRYRTGQLDGNRRDAWGIDAGMIAEHLPWADASVGLSTFLWQPASADQERSTLNAAADVRVVGAGERTTRAGYSLALTEGSLREDFAYLSGRFDAVEARAGALRTASFDGADWRGRLGLRVHYGRYVAGIAREQDGAGLDPLYQFTLSATFR